MKLTLNRPNWATKTLAGTLVLGLAMTAQAQPGAGGGGMGGGRQNFQDMTPEQRQAMMAQMETRRAEQRQTWLRQAMTASGVTDAATQTTVINYIVAQEKSKVALQAQARAISDLLLKPESTDAEVKTALTAYRASVAAARTAKDAGLAEIDTATKYSTQPKVEALLTLLGVLGPETSELGGIGEIFPDSPYGRGGFGGGRGGMGGGRGGQGGGMGGGGRRGGGGGGQNDG
jgi:uncharacterized membrane protein YgcG